MKPIFYNKKCLCNWTRDDECPEGYTDVRPLGWKYYPHLPKQHFDTENNIWILDDDCEERGFLDNITHIDALTIRRTLRTLTSNADPEKTQENDLDELFASNPQFEREWVISPNNIININDEAVIQALGYLQIDIDQVKRIIYNIS